MSRSDWHCCCALLASIWRFDNCCLGAVDFESSRGEEGGSYACFESTRGGRRSFLSIS